jgi:hypothetical protein
LLAGQEAKSDWDPRTHRHNSWGRIPRVCAAASSLSS